MTRLCVLYFVSSCPCIPSLPAQSSVQMTDTEGGVTGVVATNIRDTGIVNIGTPDRTQEDKYQKCSIKNNSKEFKKEFLKPKMREGIQSANESLKNRNRLICINFRKSFNLKFHSHFSRKIFKIRYDTHQRNFSALIYNHMLS